MMKANQPNNNWIAVMAISVLLILVSSVSVSANNGTEKTISITAKSTDNYQARVSKLFDDGYETVDVTFTDLEEEKLDCSNSSLVSPSANTKSIGPIKTYYIKNARKVADYVGTARLASTDGPPGVRIWIETTKSVSSTYSGQFGASVKSISAAEGWSVTGSTSVSIGGDYTVPYKVGKKTVKRGHLEAYPKYKTKKYDVYYGIQGTTNEVKKGTGTARKAIGVSFKKYNTYK